MDNLGIEAWHLLCGGFALIVAGLCFMVGTKMNDTDRNRVRALIKVVVAFVKWRIGKQ